VRSTLDPQWDPANNEDFKNVVTVTDVVVRTVAFLHGSINARRQCLCFEHPGLRDARLGSHRLPRANDPPPRCGWLIELEELMIAEKIHPRSSIDAVTYIEPPVWTDTYGPYSVYGFDERGYSWRTIVTHNDLAISATVGSCTWDWMFFENIPVSDLTRISHVRFLRQYLTKHPKLEYKLSLLILD